MTRTLTLGRRPFIVLGVLLSPFLVCVLCGFGYQLLHANYREAFMILGIGLLLVGIILSQLHYTKLQVDEEKIVMIGWLGEKARVYFRDVTHTRVSVLFEPDYPTSIAIYGAGRKPLMEIKPKLLKKADIAWLVSLSGLRIELKKKSNKTPEPAT